MQRTAIVFLLSALVAAFFGFGVVAASWAGAKALFFLFLALAGLSFLGAAIGRPPAL